MNPHILKTDLYQLTMTAGYFHAGLANKVVTCEAFARKLPPTRRFMVMAGTEEIREALLGMRFDEEDIEFLRGVPALKSVMTPDFIRWLEDFRFEGDLWAMAEGEIVFPGEPLVRVTAPLPQAQMAETMILSILNHDISIASKAARVVLAARGRPVLEFGTRRTHHEAAVSAARAAYLAGFAGTSNVEASRQFGIPAAGTVAHMWVMVHRSETEAFEKFAEVFGEPTLLIDTYDTLEGARKASDIKKTKSVRIDSGDLAHNAMFVRHILDERDRKDVKIIASSDLDEYAIANLMESGAPIDAFGVGTRLVSPADPPSLGIVYKVVYDETEKRPLIKRSGSKTTIPGRKQVFLDQREGGWQHLVALDGTIEASSDLSPLLDCHIRRGHAVPDACVDLDVARKYCNSCLTSLAALPLEYDLSSLLEAHNQTFPVKGDTSLRDLFAVAMAARAGVKGEALE
jgi:nicotinate phosphoribosyltransferase